MLTIWTFKFNGETLKVEKEYWVGQTGSEFGSLKVFDMTRQKAMMHFTLIYFAKRKLSRLSPTGEYTRYYDYKSTRGIFEIRVETTLHYITYYIGEGVDFL